MPKLPLLLLLAMPAMLQTSCLPTEVQVSASVATPRLVWIGPGIGVVEDSPYPLYYSNGLYWMYRDGLWYRSGYYDDGFVRVAVAPSLVIRYHRPQVYVRYRAPRGARVQVIPRRDHRREVRPRDHRTNRR